MRIIRSLALCAFLAVCLSPAIPAANAQVSIGISVNIEPPPLPVYDQPVIPGPGYLWVPGYWAWNPDINDYFWVPGTWVLPPEANLLWTPGYWAWNDDGAYVFYDGYWGPEVGFYGGVNYGFGYGGAGYEGGYWRGGAFFYNRTVNNISSVSITNVYSKTVVVNNTSRVGFNGGAGGTTARPTPQQIAFAKERHVPPTQAQVSHMQTAAKDPSLSLTKNQGHPSVAATAQPGQLKGPGVIAAHPGTPVVPVRPVTPSNAAVTPGNAGTPSKPRTLSKPVTQQPGGKPGPAGTATTSPSTSGPTTSGPGTTGPSTTGPGTAKEKKKKPPSSSATTTTTTTPEAAKPVTPPTSHPTTPPPPKPAAQAAKPASPTPHPPPPAHAGPPPGKPKCAPGQQCK
jgi:WXXGXW repeat (2 copies)